MESILESTKKLLGIAEGYTYFDSDIIMHINSVFSVLAQLGVGPPGGFSINGQEAVWNDFFRDGDVMESVKSYMYLKVRLLFDPPLSTAVLESMKRMADELEWRLHIGSDKEENQNG